MHDISRIKALQDQQEKLSGRYEELDALLDDLKSIRSNQEFIPAAINSSIRNTLSTIQANQDSFIADYEELDFGETPASIMDCKAELDDYEKYIIEKSSYVEVIQFILALDSDNGAAKSALEQHQNIVADYNCRIHSVEDCEADLKKYILLRKAFNEKDPTRRLSDIIELSPLIDFPLVVALNTNALKLPDQEPSSSESLTKEAGTPEILTINPVPEEPAVSESEQIPQIVIPQEMKPITIDPVAINPAPQQKAVTLNDDWAPPKFDLPDFRIPSAFMASQSAVSNAAAESRIENGLNAELTQVLSRENTAVHLAADVEHTASLPKVQPAVEFENIEQWRNLGIHNPAVACYCVSDDQMQIFRCDKPKKFSPSDFQKEMSLKSPNRFQKQHAMKDAYKYGATTPHMLASLLQDDPDLVEDACDTLVENGYLKAFELDGPSFKDFERLYVLTASGRRVFTHPDTAATLNLAAVQKPATPPFSSHASAVLNRQLFLKSKKLMERYMPSRQFTVGSFILDSNSFINFFPTTTGAGTYSYVSVFGKELKDYLIFKVEMQEMLPTLNTITVVGMTKEHAKALTDWIYDSFRNNLGGKTLQYYVYETDTYYTYPEGAAFSTGR